MIGGYDVLARLGEGGMGTVYLGRARPGGKVPAGRRVAVKVIRFNAAQDPGFRARFAREVDNARRVASFCTAEVLDHGVSDGRPFMVTEYIEGVPLSAQIAAGGPLTPGTLYGVAVGVAAALAAIHSAGLIHRDLKPANVLLSISGPRVIDFGIARAMDTLSGHTREGQIIGSPGWIAPEQLHGDEITPAADMFAWGCLVAYAASARHPFGTGTPVEMAGRVLYAEPVVGPLDPPLDGLVRRALDRDPAARPTAEEVLFALVSRAGKVPSGDVDRAADVLLTDSWRMPSVPSAPSVFSASSGAGPPYGEAGTRPAGAGGTAGRSPGRRMLVPLLSVLAAVALVVTAVLLAFPTGNQNPPPDPPTPRPAAGPDTLTVWIMGDRTPQRTAFFDGIEQEYHRKYPDTEVTVVFIPWGQALARFREAHAGGPAPDVLEIGNTHVRTLIDLGALADITDEMAAWREGGGLDRKALQLDRKDGRTYAMPWYAGVHGVWYRADWFRELAIDPPTTWEEFVAAASAIKNAKGVPGVAAPTRQTYAILSWVWAAGGEVAVSRDGRWRGAIDSPRAATGIRFYTDLVTRSRVAPAAYIGQYPQQQALTDFVEGRLGMYVDGTWMLPRLERALPGKVAIFPLPGRNGGVAPVFAGGSELAVWGTTTAKAAAFDYLTLLNSRANSARFADTFAFTSRYSGAVPGPAALRPLARVAGSTREVPFDEPGWTRVESTVIPRAVAAIMRGAPVETELARAAEEITTLLNDG